MTPKQQLVQVLAEMRIANNALSPPPLLARQRWVSELSAIVEQIPSASAEQSGAVPVAWIFSRAYGIGISFARPDDYEDEDGNLVTPTPLYATPQVPDGMVNVPAEYARVAGKILSGEMSLMVNDKTTKIGRALLAAAKEEE